MKRHQLKYIATFFFAASFLSLLCGSTMAAEKEFTSTHKQARFIKPMHEGKPIVLNTFCLDKDGNLLACVGGNNVEYVLNDDGSQEAKTIAAAKLLQVYSPEGELIRSVELPFTPTALNQAPDGSIFVAGDGKVARLGDEWKISLTADSPHIGDMETEVLPVSGTGESLILSHRKDLEDGSEEDSIEVKRHTSALHR